MSSVEDALNNVVVQYLATGIVGLLALTLIVRLVQRRFVTRVKDPDARYRTRKALTLASYVAAAIFLLAVFSEQLGSFTVILGVTGAGIAFALQELIASAGGWFVISFARVFRIGDRVQFGGITGDVIDVGMLRTTLMEVGGWVKGDLYNGRIVRVPNSAAFKDTVINYSADFPFLWDEIVVPIKHGSSIGATRAALAQVATEELGEYAREAARSWGSVVQNYRVEPAGVEPLVTIAAHDAWIDFTVRYVVDYRRRRTTRDRLWTRILEEVGAMPDVQLGFSSLWVDTGPLAVSLARSGEA